MDSLLNQLAELSWRTYPAAGLILLGFALLVWSTRRVAAARGEHDPRRALFILEGFRIAVVGLALAGIGAAWWWQLGSLLALSLIIGGEELLESSIAVTALRRSVRQTNPTHRVEARLFLKLPCPQRQRPAALPRSGLHGTARSLGGRAAAVVGAGSSVRNSTAAARL